MDFQKSLAVTLFIWLRFLDAGKVNNALSAHQMAGTPNLLFTQYLLFASDQRSVVMCSSKCIRTPSCVSFTFTGVKQPGNCRGHSKIMVFSDVNITMSGARTFAFRETTAWKNKSCSRDADCGAVASVHCHEQLCVCDLHSPFYSDSLNLCITDCSSSVLSSSFMLYSRAGIAGNNVQVLYNIGQDQCRQACLAARNFTCLNCEWYSWSPECYLQAVTPLAGWSTDADYWFFWQRGCQ